MRQSMVTHGDFEYALHLTHPKCTHTVVNTHTHTMNTHPEQWAAIYAAAPREQLGVRCLSQGYLIVVLRVERALYIHSPPTYNSCRAGTHTQLTIYSLTIRPRLPLSSVAQIGQFCHCLLILVLLKTCRTYAMNIKGALLNNIVLYHVIIMNECKYTKSMLKPLHTHCAYTASLLDPYDSSNSKTQQILVSVLF